MIAPHSDWAATQWIHMFGLRAAFWKYATVRYEGRAPNVLVEWAAFVWAGFFLMVYGGALLKGWRPSSIPEMLVTVFFLSVPLATGLMHRSIRRERLKGLDALYRKYLGALRSSV
jgi:hypothetical protein